MIDEHVTYRSPLEWFHFVAWNIIMVKTSLKLNNAFKWYISSFLNDFSAIFVQLLSGIGRYYLSNSYDIIRWNLRFEEQSYLIDCSSLKILCLSQNRTYNGLLCSLALNWLSFGLLWNLTWNLLSDHFFPEILEQEVEL